MIQGHSGEVVSYSAGKKRKKIYLPFMEPEGLMPRTLKSVIVNHLETVEPNPHLHTIFH
jgi:hypothetical protein